MWGGVVVRGYAGLRRGYGHTGTAGTHVHGMLA